MSRVNWRQAAGEALVIFLGVIVALMGQAWWEARSDREVVQQHMASLTGELSANVEGLNRVLDFRSEKRAQISELLSFMATPEAALRPDSLHTLTVQVVGSVSDFRPAQAALNNLLGAGDLRLVRNPELRLRISEYGQSVEEHSFVEQELNMFLRSGPTLEVLQDVKLLDAEGFATAILPGAPASRFSFDARDLIESERFEWFLVSWAVLEFNAEVFGRDLLETTEGLLELLRSNSAS